jgi:hypothetical protein
VTEPVVGWHSWRQADTAAIARSFDRDGLDVLRPAIDWSGAGPGYVESELPLFPLLVAGLYRAFGPDEIWGRLLAMLFSAGAAVYLAALCARYVDRWSAAWAGAAFALFPLASFIGVAFMPESLMHFASVAAVAHLDRWSSGGRDRDWWISAAFLAVAIAVKIPELYLGVPVTFLVWRRLGARMFLRFRVWAYAAIALVPPALWYLHAHHLKEMTGLSFGIWEVGSDKWGNVDLLASPSFYSKMLFGRLIERHLTHAGAVLLAIGAVLLRGRRDLGTFHSWVVGAVVYVVVVAGGNLAHDYYQVPVLLPLSLWVGAAIAWALRRSAVSRPRLRIAARFVVLAFLVLCLTRVAHFRKKEVSSRHLVELGVAAQEVVPEGELVVVAEDGDPTFLYHVDRRGWNAGFGTLSDDWLNARREEGAAWLIVRASRAEDSQVAARLREIRDRYPDRSDREDLYVFDLAG